MSPRGTALLVVALSACTNIDVIAVLEHDGGGLDASFADSAGEVPDARAPWRYDGGDCTGYDGGPMQWAAQGAVHVESPSLELGKVHSGIEHVVGTFVPPPCQLLRLRAALILLGGPESLNTPVATATITTPVGELPFDFVFDTTRYPNGEGYCLNFSAMSDLSGWAQSICSQTIQN